MVQRGSGSQFPCLVAKLSSAVLIYHVCARGWVGGEQNRRIFQHYGISVQRLEATMLTDIKFCASSWRRIKRTDMKLALCSA